MTVYEVAFHYKVGADDFYNVVHYDITGDTPLDFQDLADEIRAQWVATQGTVTAAAVAFQDITFRLDVDGSVGVTVPFTAGAANGTSSANKWVGQLGMLVRKLTNGVVRPNKGRAFVPGLNPEEVTAGGEWTAGMRSTVESFWDGIILVPFAGNGQAEMLLKASNPSAPNTVAFNSVVECEAQAIPVALQSRKKGRGA